MPIASLTTGVIGRIMLGEDVEKPVLQILGVKKISGGETDRYRLLISDGKYLNSYAMLATQLNHLYERKDLTEHTIIRVDKYITSVVNKTEAGKRVLIILELTVLNSGSDVGSKIGEPVSYTEGAAEGASSSSGSAAKTSQAKPVPNVSQSKPTASKGPSSSKTSSQSNKNNDDDIHMNQSLNVSYVNPICSLSPYQNKWVIKVRVMAKSAIRTWSNAKGEGKLFSMDLMDESGEIRATAFNEQATKYYDMIEVDRVYYITKCSLKSANKQYSKLNNDYEMTLNNESFIQLCDEDEGIPQIKYNLVPISSVAQAEPKSVVDTIGICKEIGEMQQFTAKTTNKEFKKRDITMVDSSNTSVQLTLWGDEAENFAGHVNAVILAKGASVNEYNGGKSLSMGGGSTLKVNPDIPEGHQLRGWYDNGGDQNVTNISARTGGGDISTNWMSFHEARVNKLGTGDKPDYFQIKAIVHTIKFPNAYYKACPQPDCNKKIIDENDGHYRCERCNAVFPEFKYRLLINMNIGDWTSNRWVTVFSEAGEKMFKRTAQEIGELIENNPSEASEYFKDLNFQSFVFKLRSKMEIYGDQNRNKLTVQSASPVNHKDYQKYLINSLKELTGIGKE